MSTLKEQLSLMRIIFDKYSLISPFVFKYFFSISDFFFWNYTSNRQLNATGLVIKEKLIVLFTHTISRGDKIVFQEFSERGQTRSVYPVAISQKSILGNLCSILLSPQNFRKFPLNALNFPKTVNEKLRRLKFHLNYLR